MDALMKFFDFINNYLWGVPMVVVLFGTHIYMTFRTGFIQRKVFKGIKLSFTPDPDSEGDVSQFAALTTALASTIGTGNIVGVGTAIALGGPGAVLWMWLTGVFGMATKYAESLIAVKYRVKTDKGEMLGGAMYALERGLGIRWLGVVFAVLTVLASFGIGSTVQANATATVISSATNIPAWVLGIALVVLLALVIIGGLKTISAVCTKLIPFMSVVYVIGCLIILVINAEFIIPAIKLICVSAFTPRAAGGGFVAAAVMSAIRYGCARGLFSNESGMGSAPLVAAAAKTKNPVRQALVSMTGTFWDTVVICLITGLTLVSTIIGNPEIGTQAADNGGTLTTLAFNQIGTIGPIVLSFGMITFAFSTMLGWSYYGDRCMEYLFGAKSVMPYRIVYSLLAYVGATASLDLVWGMADTTNALMVIPNVIAILMLSNVISKDTKFYLSGDNIDKLDDEPVPFRSEVEKKIREKRQMNK